MAPKTVLRSMVTRPSSSSRAVAAVLEDGDQLLVCGAVALDPRRAERRARHDLLDDQRARAFAALAERRARRRGELERLALELLDGGLLDDVVVGERGHRLDVPVGVAHHPMGPHRQHAEGEQHGGEEAGQRGRQRAKHQMDTSFLHWTSAAGGSCDVFGTGGLFRADSRSESLQHPREIPHETPDIARGGHRLSAALRHARDAGSRRHLRARRRQPGLLRRPGRLDPDRRVLRPLPPDRWSARPSSTPGRPAAPTATATSAPTSSASPRRSPARRSGSGRARRSPTTASRARRPAPSRST